LTDLEGVGEGFGGRRQEPPESGLDGRSVVIRSAKKFLLNLINWLRM
jgi:hypothetical protein